MGRNSRKYTATPPPQPVLSCLTRQYPSIDDLQNVWVRGGALRPTAVDWPWASCTFQRENSCTSSFLSGHFLHKTMLQKARRGKEINRGVVDQPLSHLYFSAKMKKAKGCMGLSVRSYMHTVLVTNNELCQNTRAGTGYYLSIIG